MKNDNSSVRFLPDLGIKLRAAMMAAVLCILSPIALPIGPIPVSLSVFAVLLSVYAVGDRRAALFSVVLYILIGLCGMPVFSGYAGGPAKLFGPTGGFIIGYLPMVWIAGFFVDRYKLKKWYMQFLGMSLGLLACYACGTLWFCALSGSTLWESLCVCVFPFVAFDATKMVAAFFTGNTVASLTRRVDNE